MVSIRIAPKGPTGNSTNFYTPDNCFPIFRKELKPLFIRLSGDELLKRCLKRVTQN